MAVAIDVTRQVIDSKKTEEAEERARMAIESAELGLYEIDMDRMRMITDKRFNIIVGNEHTFSRLELIRLIHPEDLLIYEKAVEESVRSGLLKYEIRIVRKDKSVRWVKATGKLTYNKDGKPMKVLGVLQDVSAQKEIEHQKDDFVAMVSHELRTPLTSMRIYSELLLEKYHLSEDQVSAGMLRKFNYQVKRLSYIIQDLVDVTRIEANKILLRKTKFELGELVKEIVSEVQIIKRVHQIVIDRCDKAMVYADRERTSQVITNLLNNAIKYSPGSKQVIVCVQAKEDEVICSITDFGYGIDKEEQAKIFDRFYQVSNINTRNTGFGLGLYISAEIIKRQNGKLWVKSEPGKGSTFYFSLQLHQ
jgi:signal transduction histidine kinase